MKRRGLVLLNVLMMTVVLGIILSSVLSLLAQPSHRNAELVGRVASSLSEEASLSKLTAAWMAGGGTCLSAPMEGVACTGPGTGKTCACVCTVAGGAVVTSSPGPGASCALSVGNP